MKIKVTKSELNRLIMEMINEEDEGGPLARPADDVSTQEERPADSVSAKETVSISQVKDMVDDYKKIAYGGDRADVLTNLKDKIKLAYEGDQAQNQYLFSVLILAVCKEMLTFANAEEADKIRNEITKVQTSMRNKLEVQARKGDRKQTRAKVKDIKTQARDDIAAERGKAGPTQRKQGRQSRKDDRAQTRKQDLEAKKAELEAELQNLSESKHSLMQYLNENRSQEDIYNELEASAYDITDGTSLEYAENFKRQMNRAKQELDMSNVYFYMFARQMEYEMAQHMIYHYNENAFSEGEKNPNFTPSDEYKKEVPRYLTKVKAAAGALKAISKLQQPVGANINYESLDSDVKKNVKALASENASFIEGHTKYLEGEIKKVTSGSGTDQQAAAKNKKESEITRKSIRKQRQKLRQKNRQKIKDAIGGVIAAAGERRKGRKKRRNKRQVERELNRVKKQLARLDESTSLSRGSLYRKRYYGRY